MDGAQPQPLSSTVLSNAEIADRLASLAQLLAAGKENPHKVKAYRRAANNLRAMSQSVDDLVRTEADLTQYPGIGKAISSVIREIVLTGQLEKLDKLRAVATPEMASISEYPRLDPKRILRVYKKLGISSIESLKEKLESGDIERALGVRMAEHVRQGLVESHAILLYRADDLAPAVEQYLVERCHAHRADAAGDYRRRVETIHELAVVVETGSFPALVSTMERYGGRTPRLSSSSSEALFALSSGILLRIHAAGAENWGTAMIRYTGSETHLRKLAAFTGTHPDLDFPTEEEFYDHFGLQFIAPELREGHDEVDLAAQGKLAELVSRRDICGELHAHTTSSDGSASIEEMVATAQSLGYEYIGISDHSQSLKIAGGLSEDDLWTQIRTIDRLNSRAAGIRILKSAEVDILADGSLDYPDDLLKELDYTVCSIHSRFGLGKQEQTNRILRAMDSRYFTILGHATGRLLLKRPGYDLDIERVIAQAKQHGHYFEINSSPDRLDLSSENARLARQAGIKLAINTDAHSTRDFRLVDYGIDQARRAGLRKESVLNCQPLETLLRLLKT